MVGGSKVESSTTNLTNVLFVELYFLTENFHFVHEEKRESFDWAVFLKFCLPPFVRRCELRYYPWGIMFLYLSKCLIKIYYDRFIHITDTFLLKLFDYQFRTIRRKVSQPLFYHLTTISQLIASLRRNYLYTLSLPPSV